MLANRITIVLVLALAGSILLFVALRYFLIALRGIKASGKIAVRIVERSSGGPNKGRVEKYRAVVEYEALGRTHRIETQVATVGILPAYSEGRSVVVRYPEGKPNRGVLVSGVEFLKWSILAAFGAASLVGAMLVLSL
jgi:hypothetical protein